MADWRSTWRKSSSTALQFSQFPFELGKFGDCILHLLDVQPLVSNLKHCRTVGHSSQTFGWLESPGLEVPEGAKYFSATTLCRRRLKSPVFFFLKHHTGDRILMILSFQQKLRHLTRNRYITWYPQYFGSIQAKDFWHFCPNFWCKNDISNSVLAHFSRRTPTFPSLFDLCIFPAVVEASQTSQSLQAAAIPSAIAHLGWPQLSGWGSRNHPRESERGDFRAMDLYMHAWKSYDIPDMPRLSGLMNLPEDVHWMQVLEENSRLRSENEALRV